MSLEWLRGWKRWQRGVAVGRVVVQLSENAASAPFCDAAFVVTDHWRAHGRCLSLSFRRNEYGERRAGPALFVGVR